MSKMVIRTCVGCRDRRPSTELLRLTVDERGHLVVDGRRSRGGRGVHVCPSRVCLTRAFERGLVARGLRRRFAAVEPQTFVTEACNALEQTATGLLEQGVLDGRVLGASDGQGSPRRVEARLADQVNRFRYQAERLRAIGSGEDPAGSGEHGIHPPRMGEGGAAAAVRPNGFVDAREARLVRH